MNCSIAASSSATTPAYSAGSGVLTPCCRLEPAHNTICHEHGGRDPEIQNDLRRCPPHRSLSNRRKDDDRKVASFRADGILSSWSFGCEKDKGYTVNAEGLTDMKGIYHRVFSAMHKKRLRESQSTNGCPG